MGFYVKDKGSKRVLWHPPIGPVLIASSRGSHMSMRLVCKGLQYGLYRLRAVGSRLKVWSSGLGVAKFAKFREASYVATAWGPSERKASSGLAEGRRQSREYKGQPGTSADLRTAWCRLKA